MKFLFLMLALLALPLPSLADVTPSNEDGIAQGEQTTLALNLAATAPAFAVHAVAPHPVTTILPFIVAQTPSATGPTASTEPASAPTLPDLVQGAEKTYDDWTKLGWLAGLMALVKLLVNLLKFAPIAKWFDDQQKGWLKPYIAAGLGALLGGLGTFATGVGLAKSIVAGLLAGLGAVGLHETTSKTSEALTKKA